MHRLAKIVLFCALAGMSVNASGAATTGLKAAIEAGMVKVTAITNGNSYHGNALKLHLVNTTRERLQLRVDPALIFVPDDARYQDLVLPAEELIALAPGGNADIDVQTFCGRLRATAPSASLNYKFEKQGDSNLIRVTQYIRRNGLYDGMGQSAIWVITDHTDLDGIIDPDKPKQSAELLALLVKLTRMPVPEYFKLYKLDTTAGQPVLRKRVLKIIADVAWKLDEPAPVKLGIYDQSGQLVQGVLDEKTMAKGGYKIQVQFEAENAAPGNYYLRLFRSETLLKEIKVLVE